MKRGLVRAAYRPGKSNAVTHPLSLMTRALRRNVPKTRAMDPLHAPIEVCELDAGILGERIGDISLGVGY